jgi:hypothetical protein
MRAEDKYTLSPDSPDSVALLMAQGWLYSFHLPAANERWGPGGFWGPLLEGMRGVFVTVVLLVVIVAFKDVVLEALPKIDPCAPEPDGMDQTLWALGALAVTLVVGMALGSSWGAFALGFLVLQVGTVPAHPALLQVLILVATFCDERAPRSDNALNLLGAEHATSAAARAVWLATSFTLPIGGRRLAVSAEWVQWGLVGLGVAVAFGQEAVG